MNYEKAEIENIIHHRIDAVKNKDVHKATADYSSKVILYDIVDPLEHHGIDALKDRLTVWLGTLDKIINYEVTNVEIHASKEVAYCNSLVHINAINYSGNKLDMWWRETTCYAKLDGTWKITHAHSSVPFNPDNGQASIGLNP